MDSGGNYLNNDVQGWKYLCMILLTEMDPFMTILMNQYMNHDCTCKMQIKPRHYLVLTVK